MPPLKSGEDTDPFGLRPNAPVSVLRAAKASLKEPTRPVTPADYGRQLFATNDPGNRPSTSYSQANSKSFYHEGGPKLALPRLDGRPDTAASGPVRKQSSGNDREVSRLSSTSVLEATLAPGTSGRGGRQTAAETVAALKASMGPADMDFSFPRPTSGSAPGPSPTSTASSSSAPPSAGAVQQLQQQLHATSLLSPNGPSQPTPSLAPEFSYGGFAEGGEGPLLDPRRNDDLPPRPGTSRGRPGSAPLSDMEPLSERDRAMLASGNTPGLQELGNGAQVLDMALFAQYSDDEENEFDRPAAPQHPHHHPQPHQPPGKAAPRPGSGQSGPALPAAAPPAPRSAASSRAPAPPATPATTSATPTAPVPAVLDPCEEFFAWRSAVEAALGELAASISGRGGAAGLAACAGRLGSLVEEARRREHSSRWLNSGSEAFRDGSGLPLSLREAVSEHVFRLMDSSNAEVLMKACGIVLRCVKSRQPLLATSKLLYRLSKDGSHDALFRREGLLEPLVHTVHIMVASAAGSSSPGNMHEPLVYLNGCLKNISSEPSNQRALVKLGALHVLAALLTQLAEQAKSGDDSLAESCGQVAVQVSGALRNLAVPPANASAFAAAGCLPALRAAASALSSHPELVLNAGRILSKLSLHEGCQAAMAADPAYAPLLVQLLGQYADHRAILLRTAFVLGNLTTHSEEYREQVVAVPFALVTVAGILQRYAFGGPALEGPGGGGPGPASAADRLSRAASPEDCLVKILRLAANLAIHPPAGRALAEEDAVAEALAGLMERYPWGAGTGAGGGSEGGGSGGGTEELVLNTVCALTNLSYYQSDGEFENKVLALPPSRLLPRITPLLLSDNEEAVVEAARVYGNFSRAAEVRDYMQASRVLDALVLLLDHPAPEVLYSAAGALVNFTRDAHRAPALAGLAGPRRLVELLGRTLAQGELTERDEALVDVVCKALFNVASSATEDAQAGAGAPSSPAAAHADGPEGPGGAAACGLRLEEVEEVLGCVGALQAGGAAAGAHGPLGVLAGRLGAAMRALAARLREGELEALPEA